MCAKVKLAVATGLSASGRLARAQERLAETRGQLADVGQRTAARHSDVAALRGMLASELLAVRAAEHEVTDAEEAASDARACLLLAEGSEDEGSAREAVIAAEAHETACVAQLVQLQAAVVATEAKVADEIHAIEALIAQDEKARRDLVRLVASLERQADQWHAAAGLERLAALVRDRQALDSRLAELRQAVRDAERDLEQSQRDAAALAQEHAELDGCLEVRELRADPMAPFHAVIAATLTYCEVLARHAGTWSGVANYWHMVDPRGEGPALNVPKLLCSGFMDLRGEHWWADDLFGPLGESSVQRLRAMCGGLVTLASHEREQEAQIRAGLPRVLGEAAAEPGAAAEAVTADEREDDETPPAA